MDKRYKTNDSNILRCIRILAATIVLLLMLFAATCYANAETIGIVATTSLNLREGPSSGTTSMGMLSMNTELTILDTVNNEIGEKWYSVITPAGNRGFVSAQFIVIEKDEEYVNDKNFEAYMTSQGFPDSYKPYLRSLHAKYPQWVFKAANTGLSWNDVVTAESKVGTSLVASGSPSSWKSMEKGAYDFDRGVYIQYDSGGWVSASKGIVAYYLDPRNFMNQIGIFQFLTHSYDPATQTKAGLQKVIDNSFMSGTFPEDTYETYADVLMEAGIKAGVNPYVLASMILVEQGRNGIGACISGTVNGYEGFYNFFNIGAYRSGSMDAVERGLWYASQGGSYERPWNTRSKSIIGGAKFYGENYVGQNKNTLYFKKFNVMNGMSNVGIGQYMTNIQGAESEAAALRNGYLNALDGPMTFEIPVYHGMPSKAASKPNSGTNNNFLSQLKVEGYNLTPEFDRYRENYELVVDRSVKSVNVTAKASSSSAKVQGAGTVSLTSDHKEVVIKVTSSSGVVRTYRIKISKAAGGQIDENSPKLASTKYVFDEYVRGVGENVSAASFKNNISVVNGSYVLINAKGATVNKGNVATGMKLVLKNTAGKIVSEYELAIKGDINGDGKVNSADALAVQRHIVETRIIKGAYLESADINADGRVNSLDVLYIQKHIVGSYNIKP